VSPFCGKALALVPLAIPRHIPSLLSFIAGTEAIRSTVAQTIHSPRRSALTRAQTWARARATDLGCWLLAAQIPVPLARPSATSRQLPTVTPTLSGIGTRTRTLHRPCRRRRRPRRRRLTAPAILFLPLQNGWAKRIQTGRMPHNGSIKTQDAAGWSIHALPHVVDLHAEIIASTIRRRRRRRGAL
jgi:hypothetical protein